MAIFVLKQTHNIYFKNWYYSEPKPDLNTKVLSGISLSDCLKYTI